MLGHTKVSAIDEVLDAYEGKDIPGDVYIAAAIKDCGGRAAFYLQGHRGKWELTQKEVAKDANMSVRTLSRLERGKRLPTRAEATQLAAVLDCDVRELL
jgi:DNA-binding XRE family transcriptional regulator